MKPNIRNDITDTIMERLAADQTLGKDIQRISDGVILIRIRQAPALGPRYFIVKVSEQL